MYSLILGATGKTQFIEKYKTYIESAREIQYFNDYTISIQHQSALYWDHAKHKLSERLQAIAINITFSSPQGHHGI